MPKVIRDTTFIGEGGVAAVQRVLMEMRFAWQPTGRFDAGIDGYIELRDGQTKEMLGAHLGAQVKTRKSFTRESDTSFEFLCDQEDVDYWMRSTLPVILICVRSGTEEAYYVCVTDYFADADLRAERRVVFDKEADRFDVSAADALADLALPPDSGVPRQGLTGPETLLTNLLPVVLSGAQLWSAPTECSTREEANALYAKVNGPRASDYLLRDRQLFSLRNPAGCELTRICDSAQAVASPLSTWADGDPDLRRRVADLLRRSLLQLLKPRVSWQPAKAIFYFSAPDPLADVQLAGPSGRTRAVVAVKYFTGKDETQRVGHIKHLAFSPRFLRFEGVWYLEVTPEWYFSWDGEREDRKADERRRWLKSRERNSAVIGHLRFWEHILTGQFTGASSGEVPVRFGPLRTERVAVGIDDRAWQGTRARRSAKAKRAKRSS